MSTDTISVCKKVTSKALHSNQTIFVNRYLADLNEEVTQRVHEGEKPELGQVAYWEGL